MKIFPLNPIKFPEANRNLLKPANMTDEECRSLWVYTDGYECFSCWKLGWRERLNILLHGKIWLSVVSGYTQPPVALLVGKTIFKRNGGDHE